MSRGRKDPLSREPDPKRTSCEREKVGEGGSRAKFESVEAVHPLDLSLQQLARQDVMGFGPWGRGVSLACQAGLAAAENVRDPFLWHGIRLRARSAAPVLNLREVAVFLGSSVKVGLVDEPFVAAMSGRLDTLIRWGKTNTSWGCLAVPSMFLGRWAMRHFLVILLGDAAMAALDRCKGDLAGDKIWMCPDVDVRQCSVSYARTGFTPQYIQCAVAGKPRFVCTDSTSLVETLLFMATLHRRDARAERMVNALLAEWPTTKSFAVPWGLAHMHYIENQLLAEGFVEREDGYKEHLQPAVAPSEASAVLEPRLQSREALVQTVVTTLRSRCNEEVDAPPVLHRSLLSLLRAELASQEEPSELMQIVAEYLAVERCLWPVHSLGSVATALQRWGRQCPAMPQDFDFDALGEVFYICAASNFQDVAFFESSEAWLLKQHQSTEFKPLTLVHLLHSAAVLRVAKGRLLHLLVAASVQRINHFGAFEVLGFLDAAALLQREADQPSPAEFLEHVEGPPPSGVGEEALQEALARVVALLPSLDDDELRPFVPLLRSMRLPSGGVTVRFTSVVHTGLTITTDHLPSSLSEPRMEPCAGQLSAGCSRRLSAFRWLQAGARSEGWRPILWEQRFARSHALSQGREKIRLNESGEERTSVPERFSELPISEETQRALHEVFGYHEMSKVQAQVIPEALAKNQDLVVRAHTGTGKTLAFLIPAVEKLLHTPTHGVAMLVISPTRELALQIHREAETLLSHHEISSLSMIGGTNQRQDQVSLRRRKPRVLIATPGRLLEHLERRAGQPDRAGWTERDDRWTDRTYLFPTLFENLQTLVLDEADRLLSLGFLPEVKEIVSYLPSRRRTMLFSATMPETVMDVISKACRGNYRYIDCESQTALMAQQSYVVLPGHQCLAALYNLIINEMASDRYGYKILVFFATARMTSFMAQFFRQQLHLGVFEIHRRREVRRCGTNTKRGSRDGGKPPSRNQKQFWLENKMVCL
eukprot:g1266.t1